LALALFGSGIDAVAITPDRPQLWGATDADVLRAAVAEGRVVVTEDVSTFPAAIAEVPDHVGVVYCRSQAFRRTPAGLARIAAALLALVQAPPPGSGEAPVIWWLEPAG
jgi:hypothetical protein